MICLKNVTKSYDSPSFFTKKSKKTIILENVDFNLKERDFIVLQGQNGSGKSTLLKLLKGIILANDGKLIYSQNIHNDDITYLSQNSRSFFLNLSLRNNLIFFQNVLSSKTLDTSLLELLLKNFGMQDLIDRKMAGMSGGELKKSSIIRAFLQKPKILLMDEAFNTLDEDSKNFLEEYLFKQYQKKNIKSLIWATHNIQEFKRMPAKMLKIENKQIMEIK